MVKEKVTYAQGDGSGPIDNLIQFLEKAKADGATHYEMEWSKDPNWAFKFINCYRYKSDEEVRQEKLSLLKAELKELGVGENILKSLS